MKANNIIKFPMARVWQRRREERMWTFLPLSAPVTVFSVAAMALLVN